jgi:amidase
MRLSTLFTSLVATCVVLTDAVELPSLLDATIDDLVKLLDAGVVSSVDIVNAYISRIDEVNDRLHAVMEINPTALEAARVSDIERTQAGLLKQPLGLLHGVPILVGRCSSDYSA